MTEPERVLDNCYLFKNMAPADLAAVAGLGSHQECAAGDFLCREGDDADAMYVVETGALEILRGGHHVATVGPGLVLGEGPFFAPGNRVLAARATEKTRLLCLSFRVVEKFLAARPAAALVFHRNACAHVYARLREMAGE
jgi:NTE family protein